MSTWIRESAVCETKVCAGFGPPPLTAASAATCALNRAESTGMYGIAPGVPGAAGFEVPRTTPGWCGASWDAEIGVEGGGTGSPVLGSTSTPLISTRGSPVAEGG